MSRPSRPTPRPDLDPVEWLLTAVAVASGCVEHALWLAPVAGVAAWAVRKWSSM